MQATSLVPAADAAIEPDAPAAPPDAPAATSDAPPPPRYHRAAFLRGATLWVVGDGGEILRHDDRGWTTENSGTTADLLAITGDSDRLVAVGEKGTLLISRGDGNLGERSSPVSTDLYAVALADGAIFAGGDTFLLSSKDGFNWRLDTAAPLSNNYVLVSSIAGDRDGDMWATVSYQPVASTVSMGNFCAAAPPAGASSEPAMIPNARRVTATSSPWTAPRSCSPAPGPIRSAPTSSSG